MPIARKRFKLWVKISDQKWAQSKWEGNQYFLLGERTKAMESICRVFKIFGCQTSPWPPSQKLKQCISPFKTKKSPCPPFSKIKKVLPPTLFILQNILTPSNLKLKRNLGFREFNFFLVPINFLPRFSKKQRKVLAPFLEL